MNNYMSNKVWDEITYPNPNLNSIVKKIQWNFNQNTAIFIQKKLIWKHMQNGSLFVSMRL